MYCIYGKNLICDMATMCNPDINLRSLVYILLVRACSMPGTVLSTGIQQ